MKLFVATPRLQGRQGLALAWIILIAAALLISLPVLLSLAGVWQAWQDAQALRRDVDRLTARVEQHFDEVNAWYAEHGETVDSVVEYGDPALARQAFDADIDRLSQALIDAGAHLVRAPATRDVSLEGSINELSGDVSFAGPMSAVAQALLAMRGRNIRLAVFNVEAVPGQPEGRVRGQMQLRQPYLMPAGDTDGQ
jgi:hypothetical protein